MLSSSWLWMYAGMALVLLELAMPGFVIFFFGLAALTVGLGCFAMGEAFTLNWQLSAFSVFSVLYLVLLRRWLKSVFPADKGGSALDDEYVGRTGKVVEGINPPLEGKVVIGETRWSASADEPLAVGEDVKVVSRSNLTLKVERMRGREER